MRTFSAPKPFNNSAAFLLANKPLLECESARYSNRQLSSTLWIWDTNYGLVGSTSDTPDTSQREAGN